jgi:hypothetical protein
MTVKLFVKDIPKNTPSHEIKRFFSRRVKILFFKKSKNKVKSINNYVIIEVKGEKEARPLLTKSVRFKGVTLSITKYLTETQRQNRAHSVTKKRIFLNDLSLQVDENFIL